MKQVLIQKGVAIAAEVPAPTINPGEILVRVQVSCLSVGTEMSGVRSSAVPLWKKAMQQPQKLTATLDLLKTIGVQRTWSLIEEKRDAAHPTGYSAAGIVESIGSKIKNFKPGDRVACAGNQYAYHAEFVRVPENLCVSIPDNISFEQASTVTLGAIALQGVRRANPTLGESFVVLGLGLLGQLTIQLLRANGCRTIGVDLDSERVKKAKYLGMDIGLSGSQINDFEQVVRLTDGFGADGVIITAATFSDEVVSTAFKMCRKKGRVVLVGDVGLNLNRSDFYAKEIDFFISSSYGPGRYDNRYEEQGFDYPISYVRWTENRNMSEYLRQIAEKRINIDPLISASYNIKDATLAYQALSSNADDKPMIVLLSYCTNAVITSKAVLATKAKGTNDRIRVAILGAGSFARSSHLPNLKLLSDKFDIRAIVSRSGHSAASIAKQFGASYASTNYQDVLDDPDIDAVIIATRHHLHGSIALQALQAGKHVLVEKPLALVSEDIDAIDKFICCSSHDPIPVLLTGYNRRFSPYAHRMMEFLKARSGPFILNYRMNAGYLPLDHWVHGAEGGGRNIGEACHIYDLFTYLTGSEVTEISAQSIMPSGGHYGRNDNFVATLSFSDGSVATITYTSLGAKEYSKELAEIYVDGKIAVMDDFKKFDVYGARKGSFKSSIQEKGLKEELIAFADAINGKGWPIPWWQQKQTAQVGFAIEQLLS